VGLDWSRLYCRDDNRYGDAVRGDDDATSPGEPRGDGLLGCAPRAGLARDDWRDRRVFDRDGTGEDAGPRRGDRRGDVVVPPLLLLRLYMLPVVVVVPVAGWTTAEPGGGCAWRL